MRLRALPILFLLAGCATVAPVDMDEPRRVVGTENAVRVDAEIRGEELRLGAPIPISYDITNQRNVPIAVADIVPVTTFDPDSNTVTVSIGSEVPGETMVPRLIAIAPGEKKSFTTAVRFAGPLPRASATPLGGTQLELRLKVNFLGDTSGLDDLLTMTQKALADSQRADELFPIWIERNEAVYTNTLPMRWSGRALEPASDLAPAGMRRRRG